MAADGAEYEIFEAGDLDLQSGETLREAKLAYKTHGRLNASKDNVVVFPTFFGGRHTQNEGMIGEGRALDPNKYFIIVPNLFGNGVSSSPSNAAPPYNRARFPRVSLYDNVACQHRLVTEVFGIDKIALGTGWPMGKWWNVSCRSAVRPGRPATTSCSWRGSSRPSPPIPPGRAVHTRNPH